MFINVPRITKSDSAEQIGLFPIYEWTDQLTWHGTDIAI